MKNTLFISVLLVFTLLSCTEKNMHTSFVSEQITIPQLNRVRNITVCLPPSYQQGNKHYPVIYMQDGQNLFQDSLSFSGEWGVDETMDSLYRATKFEAIVVGIDNGGDHRIGELTPFPNHKYGGGEGKQFLQFMIETLKPHIDSTFRTLPAYENTAVVGSSLGGLHSFYAGFASNTFSKIGAMSPSFWFSDSIYTVVSPKNLKIYISIGEAEDTTGEALSDAQRMNTYLQNQGFNSQQLHFHSIPHAAHNEKYWRKEFPNTITWLFDIK